MRRERGSDDDEEEKGSDDDDDDDDDDDENKQREKEKRLHHVKALPFSHVLDQQPDHQGEVLSFIVSRKDD